MSSETNSNEMATYQAADKISPTDLCLECSVYPLFSNIEVLSLQMEIAKDLLIMVISIDSGNGERRDSLKLVHKLSQNKHINSNLTQLVILMLLYR